MPLRPYSPYQSWLGAAAQGVQGGIQTGLSTIIQARATAAALAQKQAAADELAQYHRAMATNGLLRANYGFAANFGVDPTTNQPITGPGGAPIGGRIPAAMGGLKVRGDALYGFQGPNGPVQGSAATAQQGADTRTEALKGFQGPNGFVPGSAEDRQRQIRLNGIGEVLKNTPALAANPGLWDAISGNLNSIGVPIHAGTTIQLSAPDAASVELRKAQANAAKANATYTSGAKTDLGKAAANLDNVVAGLKPREFGLKAKAEAGTEAYRNAFLSLKARGLSDEEANSQATLGFQYAKLGAVTPTTLAGLTNKQQDTINRANSAKNAIIARASTPVLDSSGKPTGKFTTRPYTPGELSILTAQDYIIKSSQHSIKALQKGINPATGKPFSQPAPSAPSGLLPMPIHTVPRTDSHFLTAAQRNVPALPGAHYSSAPPELRITPPHHSQLQPRTNGGHFNGPPLNIHTASTKELMRRLMSKVK